MPHPYDEEERKKSRDRIARTQIQEQQMQRMQPQVASPAGQGSSILPMLGKLAAKQFLGPLGALFNKGGKVPMQGYNDGGWLSALFGANPYRKKVEEEKKRRAKAKQASILSQIGWPGSSQPVKRNMGGMMPMPLNPNGYNEGGAAMETPIKKVMEEDKIAMAREAFMLAEQRKDKKAEQEEARASEKHSLDMKLKKKSATTNKTPLSASK